MVDLMFRPWKRRILLTLRRALLTVVDADQKTQSIQAIVMRGEVLDGFEHFEPYGFTSHPHPGAEAIVAAVGGMAQHSVATVIGDKRHRPTGLEEGEVCLYSSEDEDGDPVRVILRRGREIAVLVGDTRLVASDIGRLYHGESNAER